MRNLISGFTALGFRLGPAARRARIPDLVERLFTDAAGLRVNYHLAKLLLSLPFLLIMTNESENALVGVGKRARLDALSNEPFTFTADRNR
jgi:hypothetical protein